jgi:hypothetical protein
VAEHTLRGNRDERGLLDVEALGRILRSGWFAWGMLALLALVVLGQAGLTLP